jgi:hypothetical protein
MMQKQSFFQNNSSVFLWHQKNSILRRRNGFVHPGNSILRRGNGFVHPGNGQLVKTESIMSGISVSGNRKDRYYPVFTSFFQVFITLNKAVQKETFFNHKGHKAFSQSSQRESCQQDKLCDLCDFLVVKSTFKTASTTLLYASNTFVRPNINAFYIKTIDREEDKYIKRKYV